MTQRSANVPHDLSLIRRKQVEARTGLSRTTIYRRISEGQFPKPVRLGGRTVGWIDQEIQEWINRQIAATRPDFESSARA